MNTDTLARSLKARGLRLTEPRQAVADALLSGEALTADELYEKLSSCRPAIGRATVFRTVELLEELGYVHCLVTRGVRHYRRCGDVHEHAHIVCKSCGRDETVHDGFLVTALRSAASSCDFVLDPPMLSGLCADCRPS